MYQPLPPDPASDSPARQRRTTLIFSLPALLVVCALLAGGVAAERVYRMVRLPR